MVRVIQPGNEEVWFPIEQCKPHFVSKKQQGKVTALIVYVDDMVITGDDIEEISQL